MKIRARRVTPRQKVLAVEFFKREWWRVMGSGGDVQAQSELGYVVAWAPGLPPARYSAERGWPLLTILSTRLGELPDGPRMVKQLLEFASAVDTS